MLSSVIIFMINTPLFLHRRQRKHTYLRYFLQGKDRTQRRQIRIYVIRGVKFWLNLLFKVQGLVYEQSALILKNVSLHFSQTEY
jgi:hypothetical protein